MRLNLNSPAYYSTEYGVDDEVYKMCQELSKYFRDKEYSDIVDTIGIVPIVAPNELIESGKWKEERKYDIKFRLIFVSKRVDFEEYSNGDIQKKKELIIGNILDSVKSIYKKGKFDYARFAKDVEDFVASYES